MTPTGFNKVVLITGAARRVGAAIAKTLHQNGYRIILHYRLSQREAQAIVDELNAITPNTAVTLQGDLRDINNLPTLMKKALAHWERLDVLINNASTFYSTPVGTVTEQQWEDLMGSNLKAPFFLAQAAVEYLKKQQGCIVNIVDIKARCPAKHYPVYSIAKSGLYMLTKTLAKELGPSIRVNAVAPGAILRPENDNLSDEIYLNNLKKIPLQRMGQPEDIAKTVLFLVQDAPYITGQMIAVDGGRSLVLHGDRETP